MTYILTGPASGEPLSLTEAKTHLRVETNDEDTLISDLIAAARAHLEAVTGLVLLTQQFRLALDEWPEAGVIQITRTPVQTIDVMVIYDELGDPQALALQDMVLDGRARPARLHLAQTPRPGRDLNGIEIEFTAGFGLAEDVPVALRQAMLSHIAHMYEFRGVVEPDMQPAGIPHGYHTLVSPFMRRAI